MPPDLLSPHRAPTPKVLGEPALQLASWAHIMESESWVNSLSLRIKTVVTLALEVF